MNFEAIHHEARRDFVHHLSRNELCVRIRAKRADISELQIFYWDRFRRDSEEEYCGKMHICARDKLFDYFEAHIKRNRPATYLKYYFRLKNRNEEFYLSDYGFSNTKPNEGFFEHVYSNEGNVFSLPGWLKGTVFYQIFPERFYNGDPDNDPPGKVPWGTKPSRENKMGGDISGIIEKIPYLKRLGINALYINPLFLSGSNHKYDTTDYYSVDPHFGTKDELALLVRSCHQEGIRVVLDGVFNHCGINFPPFRDLLEKGEKSEYRDWFYVTKFPVEIDESHYECVGYYKWMPKLRLANPQLNKYLLDVIKYWVKEVNIDGWRLDVADELDPDFLRAVRSEVKSMDNDLLLLGETWKDGRDLLGGDQVDSVMNYLFLYALEDFFAKKKIDTIEFDSRINKIIGMYPQRVLFGLFNLIGSHDTPRILTVCDGDVRKMKLAVGFQMTFPGVPAIFYGDEIGLEGNNDPDCRKAMEWDPDHWNRHLFDWYLTIIRLRKENPLFIHGDFMSIICGKDGEYAFIRYSADEFLYIIINNSETAKEISMPLVSAEKAEQYEDILSGEVLYQVPIESAETVNWVNDDVLTYSASLNTPMDEYGLRVIKKA